jgi:hypothetical protein
VGEQVGECLDPAEAVGPDVAVDRSGGASQRHFAYLEEGGQPGPFGDLVRVLPAAVLVRSMRAGRPSGRLVLPCWMLSPSWSAMVRAGVK